MADVVLLYFLLSCQEKALRSIAFLPMLKAQPQDKIHPPLPKTFGKINKKWKLSAISRHLIDQAAIN
jgi:hypothetical protein